MNDHRLNGVRADALLGYLKAVGILRLVAEQADPAVRGGWDGPTFVLRTALDRPALEEFFLERYRPSPVFNPWNSGAGFDAKSRKVKAGQTLDTVAATTGERWERPRAVLALARAIVDEIGESAGREAKTRILRVLRERYPDDALPWLDAAVVVGGDEPRFPLLLGTGGNDGRLDFSVNFLQRALDVVGPEPLAERSALLRDALDGTSTGRLAADVAIGQYSPSSAGGVNATTGFEAVSLVNPWDFVLLIEGVVVFAGSVVKRFGAGNARAAFPFTFASTVGGFASSSSGEETRGEVWLPRWRGYATFRAVAATIRTARVDVESSSNPRQPAARAAHTAVEAAEASIARGLMNGIDGFDRVVVAQRNGLAFAATRVGYVVAVENPYTTAAAGLACEASLWLRNVRGRERDPGSQAMLRAYDEAIFAFTQQRPDARGLQELLAALGRLDAALGRYPPENAVPFRFRDPDTAKRIAAALDNQSDEHALAAGWASVGSGIAEHSMRFDLAPVAWKEGRLAYTATREPERDLLAALVRACVRRGREAHESESRAPLDGSRVSGVHTATVASWLSGELDRSALARIERLLAGYVLLAPFAAAVQPIQASDDKAGDEAAAALPIAWCAIKLLFDGLREYPARGYGPPVAPLPLDPDVPHLLRTRNTQEALRRTYRNAEVAASAPTILRERPLRDIRQTALAHPDHACAALLLPLADDAREAVYDRALHPPRASR